MLAGLFCLALAPLTAVADAGRAYIALVMDDLGYRLKEGRDTVALPPAVTLSFLPHTPHAPALAAAAVAEGHEIMLHMPMEARNGKALGPGGLTTAMGRRELEAIFHQAILSLPGVVGVSNHMGSLLTSRAAAMGWLMEAMGAYPGLYFVDSRTAGGSVAAATAREHGIPQYTRDVFLDDDPSPAAIDHQLTRLEHRARTQGLALGIGHPYPTTLEALNAWLPALEERDIELVPVSRLIELRQLRRLANFEF